MSKSPVEHNNSPTETENSTSVAENLEPPTSEATLKESANNPAEEFSNNYSMEEFMLLKQQNDELGQKIVEFENLIKRQQAEFDNYRKRMIREKEEYFKYSSFDIFKELLALVDNFDRALSVKVENEQQESYLSGFKMINSQLHNIFEKNHVKEILGEGSAFDPTFHQAIAFEEATEIEKDTVSEVFQKGYLLHDRILRSATVKVVKPSKNEITKDENVEQN